MKEIRMILKDLNCEVVSMKEAGIDMDIEENGTTFEENAMIKANAIHAVTNDIVLADDSGLEVDYMDKAPGVYSARFMGENTPYTVKNQYIIDQLKEAEGKERSARFVCAIACASPNRETFTTRAAVEGEIGFEARGENGFGYDPIFFLPEFGCSTAELSPEQKNKISHRGKALEAMKPALKELLAE